jgi:hypothetical protein
MVARLRRESSPQLDTSGGGFAVLVMLYTPLYMPSLRTQIYLTAAQRGRLAARTRRTGEPMARLIREAVDAYLADASSELAEVLDATFGALPNLEVPDRAEWSQRDERIRGSDPR